MLKVIGALWPCASPTDIHFSISGRKGCFTPTPLRPALTCVPALVHKQIAAERAHALDLRERLAALRAKVAEQRRAMGGVNAARDGDLQARRAFRVWVLT